MECRKDCDGVCVVQCHLLRYVQPDPRLATTHDFHMAPSSFAGGCVGKNMLSVLRLSAVVFLNGGKAVCLLRQTKAGPAADLPGASESLVPINL